MRKRNEGQGTRARAEQSQAPLAENPVEQRAAEESLHHPRPRITPEGNPVPLPLGLTRMEAAPEDPREALQEVGNPRMTVPTNEGDGEPVLAPRNRRRRVLLRAGEHHQEEIRLRRTPPMTRASLAVKLQTRLMPTKSKG